jgi:hypothetical protein
MQFFFETFINLKNNFMRKFFLPSVFFAACFILTSFTGRPTLLMNAEPTVSIEEMVIDWSTYNNCTGEMVQMEGTGLVVTVANINKNRISGTMHFNMQGVKGIGETSGTVYHISNVNNISYSSPLTGGAATITGVFVANVAGGGGKPFKMKANFHSTLDAKGNSTSFVDNFSMNCE